MSLFKRILSLRTKQSVVWQSLSKSKITTSSKTLRDDKRGFTLVEIMIVVAIIALLASIAIPNLQRAASESRIANMKKNLKTFSDAYEMASSTGFYPTNLTSLTNAAPPYLNSSSADLCDDTAYTGLAFFGANGVATMGQTTVDGFRYLCAFHSEADGFLGYYGFLACSDADTWTESQCFALRNDTFDSAHQILEISGFLYKKQIYDALFP